MSRPLPPGIQRFQDDDRGFFDWQSSNAGGYFINSERNPKPNYLVLHRSGCSHFSGNPGVHWTKDYIKFCSPDRGALEEWAVGSIGGDPTFCGSCCH